MSDLDIEAIRERATDTSKSHRQSSTVPSFCVHCDRRWICDGKLYADQMISLLSALEDRDARIAELQRERDLTELHQEPPDERSRRLLVLAKRERKWARNMEAERDDYSNQLSYKHAEAEELRSQVAELRSALEPFACCGECVDNSHRERALEVLQSLEDKS